MSIQVQWDNEEKTIIRWTFPEEWDWNVFYIALQESRARARQMQHTVDILVDMRLTRTLPKNVFTHTQTTMQTSPLNAGMTVVIGVNPLLRAAFNSFLRIYSTMVHSPEREIAIVALEHKAYQLIAENRAKRQKTQQT